MHSLIKDILAPSLDIKTFDDSARLRVEAESLAFTTDSYVVDPIFFPGGDIGSLAVNGTVNDLAMVGADPLFMTVGLIIEEGFELHALKEILSSMRNAADKAGVRIVAGDTKVVGKGKADRIFINTSGIGVIPVGVHISGSNARPGDRVILSGPIGNHGIAVIAEREGFKFNPPVLSDTRPLNLLSKNMLSVTKNINAMRDPTRGGLGTTLKEIAVSSGVGVLIREDAIPIEAGVRGACELLGYDPLYVANEGVLVAFVPEKDAEGVLSAMRKNPFGRNSALIGEAVAEHRGNVVLETSIGGRRLVEMLSGEQLPRIC